MPNTLNHVRIQNALVQAVQAASFYRVTYDCTTDLANEIDEDATPETEAPKSIKAQPTGSSFTPSRDYRRAAGSDRDSWTWLLRLQFHCEVTAERFEEDLISSPPCLPIVGPDNRTNQVRLDLRRTRYTIPPSQSPSSGSEILFTFEAVALRR